MMSLLLKSIWALGYFVGSVYGYCTDFVINIANLLGLSYYEVNALIFVIIWPLLTVALVVLFVVQMVRYRRLKKLSSQQK